MKIMILYKETRILQIFQNWVPDLLNIGTPSQGAKDLGWNLKS